ncbi:MAG TPA: hypothetical protein VK737_12960, partial [Opitutales bacterium]|nr:hypothetical protein [Opitutales bacterium]
MRAVILCLLIAGAVGAGCVSEKKAKWEAQQAYMAGQEKAMQGATQTQPQRPQGPVVFVQGPVRNSVVEWQEGMKLSQAVVAADYTG